MTKDEYITRYGVAAYEQLKLKNRNWGKVHKEQRKQYSKNWKGEHRDQQKQYSKKRYEQHRINGCTPYCTKNYELIENYELAKVDNFDPKKWHLHHRLENYWSNLTLKRKWLYYDINPEALIWLPSEEHMKDVNCKNSKWHKRSLENE